MDWTFAVLNSDSVIEGDKTKESKVKLEKS